MKKTNLYLTIILVALITVILIAGILLVAVLGSSRTPSGDPTDSTSVTVSPTDKTKDPSTSTTPSTTPIVPSTTTAPTTTTKPTTTPQTPPATTTTVPVTTTKPTTTPDTPTTPPQTTTTPITPEPPAPGLNPVSGTVTGDQLGSLSLYASYVTENVDTENRTLTIRVTFYAESYALRIGARADNYLLVNGERISGLATESINLPNGTPRTRTVLYEYVTTVEKPDDNVPVSLELEYYWHFLASYSGTHADWLSVKLNLAL